MSSSQITTPGAIQIKHMLPTQASREKFDLYTPLNKHKMGELVNNLVQNGGDNYHETLNALSKLFFNKATDIGATTPLSDYNNDSQERDVIFSEFDDRITRVLKQHLPKFEQAKLLTEIGLDLSDKLEKSNLEYLLSRGSTAAKMAKTGARGNPMQLRQATASPLLAVDIKGMPIPLGIHHSYAEGLSSAEHLAASYGGRASTVRTQLSTSLPGALFKKITPAVFHEIISMSDCGTKNGVPIPVTDKLSCIGRFEAGTNKLIDETYWKELSMSNHKQVLARNPMTCLAKDGICQKCYGLAANGHLPDIGVNVGVIAAQSVSEVLTQAMLSTKHQGGVAGKQRNPYEEANNLLSNPENFQDEATMAEVNGKVNKLKQTSLKDWEVEVNGHHHFIPNEQTPLIKFGDEVRAGDPLSTGTLNPRKLVDLRGAGTGQVYLSNKMRETYSKNAKLDPRHFDIIARNMIKHNLVIDPGESEFLPGDKIEVGALHEYLRDHSKSVPLSQAEGKTLAENILGLSPGTYLDKNHIEDLVKEGVKTIEISTSGLVTKPLVPGLQNLKLLDKNWISRLSFNRLQNSIANAAALNLSSPIHSNEPVTGYMMGSEFGEGKEGKY